MMAPAPPSRGLFKLLVLVDVEPPETLKIRSAMLASIDELPEGLRSDHEPARHGQLLVDHFPEAGALAAYDGDVLLADFLEHQGIGYILWNAAHFAPFRVSE